ncbi:DUF1330 domain-containing protein [Pseudoalteromonas spongiae]|nr:DUF1330 domain-containing protein [Pseudoalteromonas spongiae]
MYVFIYIQFSIKDQQAFSIYAKQVSATVEKYGGKTIAVNKQVTPLTGEINADVSVIQQWPSLEDAEQWLASPEYAPLKKIRDEKAMENLVILHLSNVT